jgi:voltage-dependent calcium channel L type alpha-1S
MNVIFVIIFFIEAILKMFGYGLKFYFKSDTNRFDIGLVLISMIGLVDNLVRINVTALRVSRGVRILRVFKSLHKLRDLLFTLYESGSRFFYLTVMVGLFFLVFGASGMHLFHDEDG